MQTSVPRIYAAGDCVETWHALRSVRRTCRWARRPIAGPGGRWRTRRRPGRLRRLARHAQGVDLAVARTGLRDAEARAAGYAPLTIETSVPRPQALLPGRGAELRIRLTGDAISGRLRGRRSWGLASRGGRRHRGMPALYAHTTVEDLTAPRPQLHTAGQRPGTQCRLPRITRTRRALWEVTWNAWPLAGARTRVARRIATRPSLRASGTGPRHRTNEAAWRDHPFGTPRKARPQRAARVEIRVIRQPQI